MHADCAMKSNLLSQSQGGAPAGIAFCSVVSNNYRTNIQINLALKIAIKRERLRYFGKSDYSISFRHFIRFVFLYKIENYLVLLKVKEKNNCGVIMKGHSTIKSNRTELVTVEPRIKTRATPRRGLTSRGKPAGDVHCHCLIFIVSA